MQSSYILLCVLVTASLATSCKKLTCGPGTKEKDGTCVLADETAAAKSSNGATGNLTKDEAAKQIEAYYRQPPEPSAECEWKYKIKKVDETTMSFGDYDDDAKCATALEKAGLITKGKCRETGCGGCCSREIVAAGGASFDKSNLAFPCGSMSLDSVDSITTEGRKAKVTFTRTFTLDEAIVAKVSACPLDKPEPGKKKRDRTFVQDDSGTWTLQPN